MDNMDLDALEEHLGYHFGRRELLTRALTHSSFANELKLNYDGDYERMEFLGDAVLELVSSDYLYRSILTSRKGNSRGKGLQWCVSRRSRTVPERYLFRII